MRCAVILLALFAIFNTDIAVAQEDLPPLHAAVQAGDLAEVERLLEAGADPRGYTNRGLAPLDIAISEDHPRIFAALMRARSRAELPLLHATIREGYLVESQRLLEAGADLNELDQSGRSPLIDALAYGREELVYRLLEAGADPNLGEARGRSAIAIAVSGGHPGVVEALLSAGADPNSTDEYGATLLHIAASKNSGPHSVVLWKLIQAGADVEASHEYGGTPLHEAARSLNMHAMDILLFSGASLDPEIFGIVAGGGQGSILGPDEAETVQHSRSFYILQRLIGITLRMDDRLNLTVSEEEWPAAMYIPILKEAVRSGNMYVLENFFDSGSIEGMFPQGEVPGAMREGIQEALRSAIYQKNEEAVRILLEAGVPPDEADETGWTPLMSAARGGEVGIVRRFLEAGANPERIRVHRGEEQTPLSIAEEKGETDILELLRAARDGKLSSVATTCNDVRCFEEAFRACEESVVFSADEPGLNARVEYEIIGPIVGEGVSGCEVSMVYRENPNPEWVGKPVQLTLDPQRSFMEEITQGLQQCVDGTPGRYACEGPLLEVMRQ